ncbi:MAG: N-formylglutamate amidohydrolase, partial [Gammaproteobacteria bacterium]
DYSFVSNGRFKGGYITRHYGRPEKGIHALQLEIAQCSYMDEHPPYAWNPARAKNLRQVLRNFVDVLLRWSP